MSTRTWRRTTGTLLAIMSLFQACLASGLPWGAASYGGAHPGVLPDHLRVASGVAALGYAALAAGVTGGRVGARARRPLLLVVAVLMGLGAIPNLLSSAPVERWFWAPFCVVTAVCAWRARSHETGARSDH